MDFRHEMKHEISYADMLVIRQRMSAVAGQDIHAIDGKYLVRSLYFDNMDDKALREKIDGVNRREKFRIRYYNHDTSAIYLEKKSKYSAFLGETFASASIYPTDGSPLASESREKLLLIKDSFAHSLTPFLALHFDIELIDLRYYKFSTMTSFIEANSIDRVLILYNMDSVLNADTLTQLTLGIE